MTELEGRTAVVTGAASGIGNALAKRWASAGMNVVLADVDADGLQAAVGDIRASGAAALGVACDVSVAADVERVRDAAIERFGRVHLVCNNAGVGGRPAFVENTPRDAFEWVLGVNLYGLLNGYHAFIAHLSEHGEAHIVNTASAAGFTASPFLVPYGVSKHAAVALSEALYLEHQIWGSSVGISVLCPGATATHIAAFGDLEEALASRYPAPPTDMEAQHAQRVSAFIDAGCDPSVVAEAVHGGILNGQFYIFVDDTFDASIRERQEAINSRSNPKSRWG